MELAKLAWSVQGKSAGYKGTTAPAVAVMGQIGALYVAQASKIVEDQIDQRALAVGRCSAGTKAHRRTVYRDQIYEQKSKMADSV